MPTATVLKNYNCSINDIEKQATAGDPRAAYALGYIYYYGIGVTEDQQSAKLWIERSANLGWPSAIQAKKMLAQTTPQPTTVRQTSPTPKHYVNNNMQVRHPEPLTKHNYVIQLAASKHKSELQQMIHKYSIKNTSITTKKVAGKNWFVLLQGNYANRQQANAAMHDYPSSIKSLKPWIRKK